MESPEGYNPPPSIIPQCLNHTETISQPHPRHIRRHQYVRWQYGHRSAPEYQISTHGWVIDDFKNSPGPFSRDTIRPPCSELGSDLNKIWETIVSARNLLCCFVSKPERYKSTGLENRGTFAAPSPVKIVGVVSENPTIRCWIIAIRTPDNSWRGLMFYFCPVWHPDSRRRPSGAPQSIPDVWPSAEFVKLSHQLVRSVVIHVESVSQVLTAVVTIAHHINTL